MYPGTLFRANFIIITPGTAFRGTKFNHKYENLPQHPELTDVWLFAPYSSQYHPVLQQI